MKIERNRKDSIGAKTQAVNDLRALRGRLTQGRPLAVVLPEASRLIANAGYAQANNAVTGPGVLPRRLLPCDGRPRSKRTLAS